MDSLKNSRKEVPFVYGHVIKVIIKDLEALFRDEEHVLEMLKSIWLKKLEERNVVPQMKFLPPKPEIAAMKIKSVIPKSNPVKYYTVRYSSRSLPCLTDEFELEQKLLNLKKSNLSQGLLNNNSELSAISKKCVEDQDSKAIVQMKVEQLDGPSHNAKFRIREKIKYEPRFCTKIEGSLSEIDSGDDLTDEDASSDVFECENIIFCKYENIKKRKNKWKIMLKHGMMHLNNKDYVFDTASTIVNW